MSDTLLERLAVRLEAHAHPLYELGRVRRQMTGLETTELSFTTAADEPVRGVFCRPEGAVGALPAVLVIHAHGNRYDIGASELMDGRPALVRPLGPELAGRGVQTLCIDLPCFGTRATNAESAAAKAALWEGRSLAGQMVGECVAGLDWLAAEPGVDAARIGVFGISMGATLGYWLAALDARVRALVHECCLADFSALIATGAHDLHGPYLTVPGLLNLATNGVIAGMVAPRAQFIGWGALDPLTPPEALDGALGEVRQAYAEKGGQLVLHGEPDVGHKETPAMRRAAVDFLCEELLG